MTSHVIAKCYCKLICLRCTSLSGILTTTKLVLICLQKVAAVNLRLPLNLWNVEILLFNAKLATKRVQSSVKVEPSSGRNFFMYNLLHYRASIRSFPFCPYISLKPSHLIYMDQNFPHARFFVQLLSLPQN